MTRQRLGNKTYGLLQAPSQWTILHASQVLLASSTKCYCILCTCICLLRLLLSLLLLLLYYCHMYIFRMGKTEKEEKKTKTSYFANRSIVDVWQCCECFRVLNMLLVVNVSESWIYLSQNIKRFRFQKIRKVFFEKIYETFSEQVF